jgi:hypothetical protein
VEISFNDVDKFLSEFKLNMKIWNIVFRNDRLKNIQTLIDLEISDLQRTKIIENLLAEDYSEGPLADTLNKLSPMWVFGKQVKGKEVYIKITMGTVDNPVICISFHLSERLMKYPFKK